MSPSVLQNMTAKLKVVLKLDGVEHKLTIPDDLQVSVQSLNKDLGEQPGWYAHYGLIAARLSGIREQKAQALKDISAAVEIDIRAEVLKSGEKSTEDKIRAKVQLHETVIGARQDLMDAERSASEASVIKESFYHRKDALIALAANYRAELTQPNSH